ncbi:MAG TPA: hypothetical protein VJ673_18760 [Aromatoleum sp.]|uniref:phage integrase central domain-containing protein n=1 Tax=Aromatoleum sp. TaxID=2307007 RepID=UPI002B463021|nr:hypothetical protein [Aromatoleum sp.]HJV27732.1 hypothetical protein [Aromatoleum sp.]
MSGVIGRYLKEVVPEKAKTTQASNKLEPSTLTKVFGSMKPADITAADVWDFVQARAKTSKVRANRERSLLQDVMRHAIMWGHCKDNPVREQDSTHTAGPDLHCLAPFPIKALTEIKRPISSTQLVTSRDGSPMTLEGRKTAWGRTMDKAIAENAISERFHFHDNRAKTVTDLKAAGRDAKSLSGHASESIVEKVYDRRSMKKANPLE